MPYDNTVGVKLNDISILKKAIAGQHQVTALVRSPEKLQVSPDYFTVYKGNVLDEKAVHDSMKGASTVSLEHR
ncbi:NAD(P)H-binding protein [Virgibacillus siamensis]|uniref:NAD(P)H-binding protein n=1 Tax=Virgibacillus siamensis TaxID=480071 RepID=UPI0031D25176